MRAADKLHEIASVMIVFFNREEDGLLGSSEFVAHLAGQAGSIKEAHIFEMVGYSDGSLGSQSMPPRLPPLLAPDVGNFLALLANRGSNMIVEKSDRFSGVLCPAIPCDRSEIYFGLEKAFGDLNRSDHAPFWRAGIPCIMWTDTSEFRNPHYHLASDTPDTLDYAFMSQVTKLAPSRAISASTGIAKLG
jgi:Zn-dependent M28 family amino/carboxypeptidase